MTTDKQIIEKLKELVEHLKEMLYLTGWAAGQPETTSKKLIDEISALESQSEEESYPKEFVEWINWEDDRDDFHFIRDYTMNLWLNADEDMLGYNTDELFDYWQSKVKPK